MIKELKKLSKNDKVGLFCKIGICVVLAAFLAGLLFRTAETRYWDDEAVGFESTFAEESIEQVDLAAEVRQSFYSQANTLTSIKLYLGEILIPEANLELQILNQDGTVCFSQRAPVGEYRQDAWNVIPVDLAGLRANEVYILRLFCDQSDAAFAVLDNDGEYSEYISECFVDGQSTMSRLALDVLQVDHLAMSDIAMQILADITFLGALMLIFCYAVFRSKQGFRALKQDGWRKSVPYALVWSLNSVFLFQPLDALYTQVENFKRVFGQGTMSDVDIGRIVNNFALWVALFSVFFFASLVAWAYLRIKYCQQEVQKRAWHFLDQMIVLALVGCALRALLFFQDGTDVLGYAGGVMMLVLLTTCIYLFTNLWKKVRFEHFQNVIFITFCLGFILAFLFGSSDSTSWFLLGLQLILAFFGCILMRFAVPVQNLLAKTQTWLWVLVMSAAASLTALPLYIEAVNILFGRQIVFANPTAGYSVTIAIICVLMTLAAYWMQKKKGSLPDPKRFSYPLVIVGVSALTQMIPLTDVYTTDLFESANAGILISGFLNFGQIPLVEHYGGHMMGGVWEGILYGILNDDPLGAVFSPYGGATLPPYTGMIIPVIALAFYYVLKYVWQEDAAFWTTLLFPFLDFWNYYGLGFIIVIPVVWFLRNSNYRNAVLIWLACLFVTLYRLDLGFSFDLACAIALAVCLAKERNAKAAKPLLITLGTILAVCGGLWVALCLWRGIHPIKRLVEFLQIGLSNSNWAYSSVGNPELFLFAWCYLAVPFFISATLLYLFLSKSFREKVDEVRWVLLLISGFSYLFNFSRGLVRHNLAESLLTSQNIVLWCAYFYMALFLSCFFKKKYFIPVLAGFLVLHAGVVNGNAFRHTSLVQQASETLAMPFEGWLEAEQQYYAGEPIKRVEVSKNFMSLIEPLEEVVDLLLEEDETYIDFVNRTITYPFLGKKTPVYLSQSPLQLSGEFTQECFVEQIAKNPNQNPIVVMPYSSNAFFTLDGLANTYRYYKVAEYLYQNYTPLCHNGEYAVWCLNNRYDEMIAKLSHFTQLRSNFSDVDLQSNELNVLSKDNSLILEAFGKDPFISGIETWADFTPYMGQKAKIKISYRSDRDGLLQMYYVETSDGIYQEEDSVTAPITKGTGTAEFIVPIGSQPRLRLDVPENSALKIFSVKVTSTIEPIAYGYDWVDPLALPNGSKENHLHYYFLGDLARIWAEQDYEKAAENTVIAPLTQKDNTFTFGQLSDEDKAKGNYLLLHVTYAGEDNPGYTKADDEKTSMTVRVGSTKSGTFEERYAYEISISEGSHNYAIRISNDYYWYTGRVDSIQLDCDASVTGLRASILEGD